jgi:hypothetical protein
LTEPGSVSWRQRHDIQLSNTLFPRLEL